MRLRVALRRVQDDIRTVDELLRVQFADRSGGLDLRPSFYDVAQSNAVQTYAEHSASFRQSAKSGDMFEIGGLPGGDVVATPGETDFQFTQAAHRELVFQNATGLRSFAQPLMAALAARTVTVKKKDLKAYVQRRLATGDLEWATFCGANPGNSHCKA